MGRVEAALRELELDVAVQPLAETGSSANVFAVVRAPRGDGTEALLVSAPWRLVDGTRELAATAATRAPHRGCRACAANDHGVTLLLALAPYLSGTL